MLIFLIDYSMTRKNKGATISIDWKSEDAGYSVLTSKKMVEFANKHNLIQTYKPFKMDKTKLYLKAVKVDAWPSKPTWKSIECNEINSWIKTTPCVIGKNIKMFVKLKGNAKHAGLGSYIHALVTGKITEEKHKIFVKELMVLMKDRDVIIHNEDVDWFHLKSIVT
jgi:hypothetical protein